MYCDKCDITIPYSTDTCPLCFKKLSDDPTLDNPIYPRRDASFRFPAKYSFTLFYSVIAIAAFLIVLLINLLTDTTILWALIVGAGLIYIFTLIRHTIMTAYGSAGKIFVQGVLVSALLLIIQNITHTGVWAYEYVIPMALVGNTMVLWALTLIRRIRRANYAFALVGMSIFDLVPFIWYMVSCSHVFWTMIVSTGVALITVLLVVLVFRRQLTEEIKRLLHI